MKISPRIQDGKYPRQYYTFDNLGWVLAPLAAAFLLGSNGNNFSLVFLVIAAILVPIIILVTYISKILRLQYSHTSFLIGHTDMLRDRDMRGVYIIDVLIQAFYALMIIYTPIYLHNTIGFIGRQSVFCFR